MDARTPPLTRTDAQNDEAVRRAMELLFFAYRDFIAEPDNILRSLDFGRAHHRVIHFVGRNPGITVSELLDTLKITKQSLGRVLSQLVRDGVVRQDAGTRDKRHRHLTLTEKGRMLEERVSADQRRRIAAAFAAAGPGAVAGFEAVLRQMINDPADLDRLDRRYG
jgi:DNA-binding MarR family transcriptional regulator